MAYIMQLSVGITLTNCLSGQLLHFSSYIQPDCCCSLKSGDGQSSYKAGYGRLVNTIKTFDI